MDCTQYHSIFTTPTICMTLLQHIQLMAIPAIGILVYALVMWGMDKKKDQDLDGQIGELFKRP